MNALHCMFPITPTNAPGPVPHPLYTLYTLHFIFCLRKMLKTQQGKARAGGNGIKEGRRGQKIDEKERQGGEQGQRESREQRTYTGFLY